MGVTCGRAKENRSLLWIGCCHKTGYFKIRYLHDLNYREDRLDEDESITGKEVPITHFDLQKEDLYFGGGILTVFLFVLSQN